MSGLYNKTRDKYCKTFFKPSRTKQAHKSDCDINNILAKYKRAGVNPLQAPLLDAYRDVSGVVSYQDALNQVHAAQELFDALPAHVRKFFKNDPLDFVEYCADPVNADELVKLGLANKKVVDKVADATPI